MILQGRLEVGYGQSEIGHLVGLHPDLHGIVAATDVRHTPYAGNAAQQVEHVQGGKVAQVDLVELRVGRVQADGEQLAGRLLFDRDAVLYHFRWQTRFGQFDAILDFHGRQVGIGVNVEGDGGRETSGVRAARLHIEHARRTVQLLLDGGSHRLRNGQGAGSRIRRTDFYNRRRDLRILVDGQQAQADDADNDNQYRDDGREYGPVDKETYFHTCTFLVTFSELRKWFRFIRLLLLRWPQPCGSRSALRASPSCRGSACGSPRQQSVRWPPGHVQPLPGFGTRDPAR